MKRVLLDIMESQQTVVEKDTSILKVYYGPKVYNHMLLQCFIKM